jgi:hypothetical protein
MAVIGILSTQLLHRDLVAAPPPPPKKLSFRTFVDALSGAGVDASARPK